MRKAMLAGAAMVGALAAAGVASSATFMDYVSVLVPGNQLVLYETFSEASETFVGFTGLPVVFTPGTILLTEPTTGVVDDVLSILPAQGGGVNIFFFSDAEGGPPLLDTIPPEDLGQILATLPETGSIQDVSQYFTSESGDITVQVGSDIDVTVPEPASWALMLIGVGGLGAALRRRASASSAA